MKISLDWLRDYVDITINTDELASRLTSLGIEVESVEDFAKKFDKIVVGEVHEVRPHPNADKLRLTKVSIGVGEMLPIVCGAPNVRVGLKVAVATIGADLGEGFVIKKSKIRGEISEGMLCSEKELGLSDDHAGIWELPNNYEVGAPLAKALGKEDTIFEIGITPNRSDCLSHIGVAREVVIAGGSNFSKPIINKGSFDTSDTNTSDVVSIAIAEPQLCPRYAARVIRGVKVGESPDWLKNKLESVGLRPRNNIVDVTNYVLMECGHPLHAFDLSAVKDNRIIVRTAKDFATKFVTLDGKERLLPESALLITDCEKPLAIAGVMGGSNSEIHNETTDVLIESAYFHPSSIRRTAKSLGLSTDASYRFERGTDIGNIEYAVDRAASLISELAGGEVLGGIVDEYPQKLPLKSFTFRPSRTKTVLGMEIVDGHIEGILLSLGVSVEKTNKDVWTLTSPSYRVDLEHEIDAIEEVARVIGYESMPINSGSQILLERDRSVLPIHHFNALLRQYLIGLGFSECISTPMLSKSTAEMFGTEPVEVLNPLTSDFEVMRTGIIPNLLEIARRNERFGARGQRIFEIGDVFSYGQERNIVGSINQQTQLGILIKDIQEEKSPYNAKELHAEIYILRSIAEQLLCRFGITNFICEVFNDSQIPYYSEGTILTIKHSGRVIATLGELSPLLIKEYDLRTPPFAAVFEYGLLHSIAKEYRENPKNIEALPKYPSIERDFAFVMSSEISAGRFLGEVREALPKELLEDVRLFDEFQSKEMKANGERSLGVRVTLRSKIKTMEDEEVERIATNVVTIITKNLHARLRS